MGSRRLHGLLAATLQHDPAAVFIPSWADGYEDPTFMKNTPGRAADTFLIC